MRRWSRPAVFLCLLGLCLTTRAAAQNLEFGILGGMSFSKLALSDGNALENPKNRVAFTGGGFLTWHIGNILAIQPEVLLSMKGTAASNPTQNFTTGDLKLKMDYIEVPILVKAYIPIGNDKWVPNVFAGPAFAWLINCRVGEDVIGGTRDCANGGPTIKDTDYSIMTGIGVDFLQHFTAQVRYDIGMNDVDEDQGTANNRTLSLIVGYIFQL